MSPAEKRPVTYIVPESVPLDVRLRWRPPGRKGFEGAEGAGGGRGDIFRKFCDFAAVKSPRFLTKHEAPRSVNYRATQNKNNIGTTALERSVVYITGGGGWQGLKAFHCTNFILGLDIILNTKNT